jgi:hypothetical protein
MLVRRRAMLVLGRPMLVLRCTVLLVAAGLLMMRALSRLGGHDRLRGKRCKQERDHGLNS